MVPVDSNRRGSWILLSFANGRTKARRFLRWEFISSNE